MGPPVEIISMIKMLQQSVLFYQFQFLLAFSRTTVAYTWTALINNNINIDNQGDLAPSIQIFANQFTCITREKLRAFVLKAAISGPHLYLFMNVWQ